MELPPSQEGISPETRRSTCATAESGLSPVSGAGPAPGPPRDFAPDDQIRRCSRTGSECFQKANITFLGFEEYGVFELALELKRAVLHLTGSTPGFDSQRGPCAP